MLRGIVLTAVFGLAAGCSAQVSRFFGEWIAGDYPNHLVLQIYREDDVVIAKWYQGQRFIRSAPCTYSDGILTVRTTLSPTIHLENRGTRLVFVDNTFRRLTAEKKKEIARKSADAARTARESAQRVRTEEESRKAADAAKATSTRTSFEIEKAVESLNYEKVRQLLKNYPQLRNTQFNGGWLFRAMQARNATAGARVKMLETLVASGCDPKIVITAEYLAGSKGRVSLLHLVVSDSNSWDAMKDPDAMAEALIKLGTDPVFKDHKGQTPLEAALAQRAPNPSLVRVLEKYTKG